MKTHDHKLSTARTAAITAKDERRHICNGQRAFKADQKAYNRAVRRYGRVLAHEEG